MEKKIRDWKYLEKNDQSMKTLGTWRGKKKGESKMLLGDERGLKVVWSGDMPGL